MALSQQLISQLVKSALDEDLNYQSADGDITAQLIPATQQANAKVITREAGIFCGKQLILEVFEQVDPSVIVNVLVNDGEVIEENQTLFTAVGNARAILTAERTALNFVQTLSGTATTAITTPLILAALFVAGWACRRGHFANAPPNNNPDWPK